MKLANLIKTNEVVAIVAVNGGWTTINRAGVEEKVRNGALSLPWEGEAPTTAPATPATKAKAEKPAKTTKKADPKKKPTKGEEKHHGMSTTVCPRCGSTELFVGRAPEGIVIDEDKIIGCHVCGWEYKVPGFADGLRRVKNSVYDPANYTKATSANGHSSLDCGDKLAAKLRGMPLDDVYRLAAKELGVTMKELHARYGHLNFGMQRMNLGNRLRSIAK